MIQEKKKKRISLKSSIIIIHSYRGLYWIHHGRTRDSSRQGRQQLFLRSRRSDSRSESSGSGSRIASGTRSLTEIATRLVTARGTGSGGCVGSAPTAGAAGLASAFDHAAQDTDDFGGVFEALVVHAFLRVVDVCDRLFG